MRLKVSDFDFQLPESAIAQVPAEPRDSARLLVHDIELDRTEHRQVRELDALLDPRDLLVVNDTRVRHARLVGRRRSGAAVELLLLERRADGAWRTLARPAGKLRAGEHIELESGRLSARMLERGADGGQWFVDVVCPAGERASDADLERVGRAPLPPYIRRPRGVDADLERDRESYQTVFASELGAVAAPTAGLHFTPALLDRLAARGIERASVTLHVGEGTFKPVIVEDVSEHVMHAERVSVGEAAVAAVARCRERGGRVVAVGTTSARALESAVDARGEMHAGAWDTRLFLVPGSRVQVVDVLLTNFHLPRSTLLMLVSAFAGRERVLRLYREALERGYRFYSYGDAMLLKARRR